MAGPTYAGGNVLYFAAEDQEITGKYRIRGIAWTSNQGSNLDIAVDDDMLLEDGSGNVVIGKRAKAAGEGLEMTFPGDGIIVNGLKAEDLDGGVLFVYVDKL